jgi:hypothetical protein
MKLVRSITGTEVVTAKRSYRTGKYSLAIGTGQVCWTSAADGGGQAFLYGYDTRTDVATNAPAAPMLTTPAAAGVSIGKA